MTWTYDMLSGESHYQGERPMSYVELFDALERVKALHVITDTYPYTQCASDKMFWPCPTIRALRELS